MPVISCHNCSAKLKVPDSLTGGAKCPKCHTPLKSPTAAPAAFEVIEEDEAGSSPSPAKAARTPKPNPGAKPSSRAVPGDEPPSFSASRKLKEGRRSGDEEEETRPRKGNRGDERDEGDDTHEEDRPRDRGRSGKKRRGVEAKRSRGGGGGKLFLILGGVVAGAAAIVVVGVLSFRSISAAKAFGGEWPEPNMKTGVALAPSEKSRCTLSMSRTKAQLRQSTRSSTTYCRPGLAHRSGKLRA